MKWILFPIIVILFFLINLSCNLQFRKNTDRINALNMVLQTDVDFSQRSKEAGMKKAFLEYMHEDGTLLLPNKMPIIGADAVEFISSINDSSLMLSWQPQSADVSKSLDMGYTFGIYILQIGDSVIKGTYVTIWKKQADGKWQFVLDSGNAGVEEVNEK